VDCLFRSLNEKGITAKCGQPSTFQNTPIDLAFISATMHISPLLLVNADQPRDQRVRGGQYDH
jgi:hypothetical protein